MINREKRFLNKANRNFGFEVVGHMVRLLLRLRLLGLRPRENATATASQPPTKRTLN